MLWDDDDGDAEVDDYDNGGDCDTEVDDYDDKVDGHDDDGDCDAEVDGQYHPH